MLAIKILSFSFISSLICLQLTSLISTGLFIPPLAISNIDQFKEAGNHNTYTFSALLLASFSLLFFLSKKTQNKSILKKALAILVLLSPSSPVYSLTQSVFKVAYQRHAANKYKKYAKETYNRLEKSSVSNNSEFGKFVPKRHKNVIVIFTEGMSYDVI
ncbi:hypothetical protein AB4K05_14275 [Kluyvera sp. STS39-E]|uniref:hypothetical protein n=1 Tax=Kluyvera sp. STS39-E TaxID=3234748 RepID=UPI0034C69AAD